MAGVIGIHTQNRLIDDATGTIDFGGDIAQNVPRNKQVVILQVADGQANRNPVEFCGVVPDRTPATWCPLTHSVRRTTRG